MEMNFSQDLHVVMSVDGLNSPKILSVFTFSAEAEKCARETAKRDFGDNFNDENFDCWGEYFDDDYEANKIYVGCIFAKS